MGMYDGIADRLKSELVSLAPSGAEIRVIASADRKYAVWKGGSTLASLTPSPLPGSPRRTTRSMALPSSTESAHELTPTPSRCVPSKLLLALILSIHQFDSNKIAIK